MNASEFSPFLRVLPEAGLPFDGLRGWLLQSEAGHFQSENKNKPSGVEFHDQVTYFYLDFTAELPDGLFSPEWQGDLLGGINFRRGAKPPGA
jgi:hypothetical protein